jgi:hypothetical protein
MNAQDLFPALAGFPDAVTDVAEVPKDVTSLRLTSKVQNWASLQERRHLERLWCFDLDSLKASTVGRLTGLRRLYVDGCRLKEFGVLSGLASLEVLSIGGCTKVESLASLSPFRHVRGLRVEHFPKVHSLNPLSEFDSVEALAVAGGMWTRMIVESLAPLAGLTKLQYLHLTNLKARDESLEPLSALTDLRNLDLANFYSIEEFAKLSARLKKTACTWFSPTTPIASISCRLCGGQSMVMLTGKRMPMLCTSCDKERVRRHEELFKNLAARAT